MLKHLFSKRFTLVAVAIGLGLIAQVAINQRLIPSIARRIPQPIGQLTAHSQPIDCPEDVRIHPAPTDFLNANQPLATLLPANFDRDKISVLIEKSQYRLTVYYNQAPVKSYAVVFGNSSCDKRQEGDCKTPEGILKIQDKYPHPSWSKFLWLDYPNAQSKCKHNRAKQMGEIPQQSAIGGEIGIHGVPIGQDSLIDERNDWTLGCPSLKTQDINELYDVVKIGTLVEIVP